MKRIILFRYHNNFDLCIKNLELLKYLNPNLPIYGLYGGEKDVLEKNSKILEYFVDNYTIVSEDNEWKWLHSDLAYVQWFNKVGEKIDFDYLHIIEWDLLLTVPLEKIYANSDSNTIYFTGLTALKNVEKEWFWTRNNERKDQWNKLLQHVKEKYEFTGETYATLGPGWSFPKQFFEKYSKADIPLLAHDELRLPLFAAIFNFNLNDTGFYKKWFSKKEERKFNCGNIDITISQIKRQLKRKNGRRVFHPFRSFEMIDEIYEYIKKITN